MSWSEVKHATNSTLGTGDFNPLDKLFKKEIEDLYYNWFATLVAGWGDENILVVPKSTSIADEQYRSTSFKVAILPSGIESIGEQAFSGCGDLEQINIPDTVKSFGEGAFAFCGLLNGFKIPWGVKTLSNGLFQQSDIKLMEIPDSVTSIGIGAFYQCLHLEKVKIPNSVTSIGEEAFRSCTELKDVYYSGTEEQWSQISIGEYNSSLTNATIHYNS